MANEEVRDLDAVRLPRWGRVVAAEGAVPWSVVSSAGEQVEPIQVFLVEFVLRDNRVGSVRSYAYGLLRWWRWLRAIDVAWDRASPAEVRDFVLWLRRARKGIDAPRPSGPARGSVNPITGKQYLDDRYKPRTIRHSNAVLRSFYEFWIERGAGPLINPVQLDHRGPGQRAHAHHNPLSPYLPEGRIRYNPKVPKRGPRAMSDERWAELFAELRSNRDRAILALTISNGARASEVLGVRAMDLDWGDQRVRVFRKGSGAEQWLPASSEAFVWIRLYLAELGDPLRPTEPVWWTIRRRDRGAGLTRQPLNYDALRAVIRRANTLLGANWSMHDLRHTAGLRMSRDTSLTLKDVQIILGHAHLSTTADVYLVEEQSEIIRRVQRHLAGYPNRPEEPPSTAAGYDPIDLAVLFGGTR